MSIFYINNGETKKIRHHKDIRMPQNVSVTIPKEMTGCCEQHFESSTLKPVIRFRKQPRVVVDADNKKLCILYASSAKDFFKVSIRLTKPYVYNVKEIGELLTCTFLKRPRGSARGMNIEDVPGNIKSKIISGMELYVPKPSKYTQERDEILGKEKQFINPNYLGYWVFDQKLQDDGIVVVVGNEDKKEYVRYIEVGSLPEGKDIVTAYVRPCFWEEYDL